MSGQIQLLAPEIWVHNFLLPPNLVFLGLLLLTQSQVALLLLITEEQGNAQTESKQQSLLKMFLCRCIELLP